ncbi:metacaspase-9-like [Magnolia sinica]|uniref:metacaspase-9-like n=1 Tax=Magnolia sinica TaxID=86752 RepID=UPI002659C48A|nr:metacaspase-9-like [Magnolia sinica]
MRKKSAILVGCGYYGTPHERYGCQNDVKIIEEVLNKLGFLPENIRKLIETNTPDSPNQPIPQPTMANIQNELNHMKSNAGEGDVLFFYFSGSVNHQSNRIPALYCCDKRLLPATDFRYEDNQLPEKTSFTLVLESSHGAEFIHPVTTDNNRILFNACQEDEKPKRLDPKEDIKSEYGAFTNAIQTALHENPPPISNEHLLRHVNERLKSFNQHAGLHCNADNQRANFLEYLTID